MPLIYKVLVVTMVIMEEIQVDLGPLYIVSGGIRLRSN